MGSLAPTAAHAVKAQGVQTGTRRAGARTRQGHWVREPESTRVSQLIILASNAWPTPLRSRLSKTPASKMKNGTFGGQISVQSQHGAFSASYIWEIQYHAARARVMPHTARTFAQHPGMDACAPRARRCALFNTAHLQPHSPRAQKALDNLKGIRLHLRVLIMNTMLKMGTGSVTVHPEGLPSSTSARTKGSVRQRRKRHILSGPREVTVGGQAMPLVDVQPRT